MSCGPATLHGALLPGLPLLRHLYVLDIQTVALPLQCRTLDLLALAVGALHSRGALRGHVAATRVDTPTKLRRAEMPAGRPRMPHALWRAHDVDNNAPPHTFTCGSGHVSRHSRNLQRATFHRCHRTDRSGEQCNDVGWEFGMPTNISENA